MRAFVLSRQSCAAERPQTHRRHHECTEEPDKRGQASEERCVVHRRCGRGHGSLRRGHRSIVGTTTWADAPCSLVEATPPPESLMPPRVSIITRTKDRPVFLLRALRSVRRQTFSDWEVVVVNDGGDRSIVDDVIIRSGIDARRVRVIDHPVSRGRWEAANAGVLAAAGEFIVLHDDDDSWAEAFLGAAVAYLDEHPDRRGVVSRIEIVWEQRVGDRIEVLGREEFLPDAVAPLLMDQLQFNRFVPIAFLYRRTVHDEVGLYDEDLPVVGDWLFNTKVLRLGPLEYLAGDPLVYWHQRPSATGVDGNSVIESGREHALHDALVRDSALRESMARDGEGLALYLTRYIDKRVAETEFAIRADLRAIRDEATNPLFVGARRAWRQLRRRH
ncbi:glycosyltransferase [Microbacterium sp. NPDC077184]|uniref:glycosyltransferase family 2 protein n=1 Tax=Microbacterium sp. NPDC077184 TaxID=3154764 RepID=UPI00343F5B09